MYMIGITEKLLLIDGNPSHARVIRAALVAASDGPFQLDWSRTLSAGLERLSDEALHTNLLGILWS